MAKNAVPSVGARIKATKVISYTLDEFEDNPLVLKPGDEGTVVSVDEGGEVAYVEWDNDPNKNLKKAILPHSNTDFRFL